MVPISILGITRYVGNLVSVTILGLSADKLGNQAIFDTLTLATTLISQPDHSLSASDRSTPLYICFDQPTPGLISYDIQNQQLNRLFDLHKN